MFFQNAKDAIEAIKKTFVNPTGTLLEGLESLDETRNKVVFAFAKELDDLTEKYEILKADYERVAGGWSEINGRYSKLETRFDSLYEFVCMDCRESWDELLNREDEDAEQC